MSAWKSGTKLSVIYIAKATFLRYLRLHRLIGARDQNTELDYAMNYCKESIQMALLLYSFQIAFIQAQTCLSMKILSVLEHTSWDEASRNHRNVLVSMFLVYKQLDANTKDCHLYIVMKKLFQLFAKKFCMHLIRKGVSNISFLVRQPCLYGTLQSISFTSHHPAMYFEPFYYLLRNIHA